MLLSELKSYLAGNGELSIALPGGGAVPAHFHLTEIGEVTKNFIDCGGTLRRERKASLQFWTATDYDHRLEAAKAVKIIEMAERQLGLGDLEIEVEYQGPETVQKYGLATAGEGLALTPVSTDCLARELCTPAPRSLATLITGKNDCAPGSGCC